MRRNIIFSTTRQWNPGDEIILKGIINLLCEFEINFNPLIFNRNPDVRSFFGVLQYRKKAELKNELWHYTKSAMMDNSVKPWMEYENIDAIIFAGTPEWQGDRSRELYLKAIRYHIPVYMIGIDSAFGGEDPVIVSVLRKAKFISIRNKEIERSFLEKGISVEYLPCPSIFSSKSEKIIDKVRCIGLIYRGEEKEVTYGNGWNKANYQFQNELFRQVILKYKKTYKFVIICHYVDELYLAHKDFPEENIRYSYDSSDYIEFYKECDLVIGSRIHGIGIATSMGIPSIPIKYDRRAGTINGFYPKQDIFKELDGIRGIEKCLSVIKEMNQELINYKKESLSAYQDHLKGKLDFQKVKYDYISIGVESKYLEIVNDRLCKLDIYAHNHMKKLFIQIAIDQMNQLIEEKRVVIKGAGEHTKELLKYLTNKTKVICIVDNVCDYFDGYPVKRNKNLYDMEFDYIIISSYRYEDEMIEEIETMGFADRIVSIYRIIKDNFESINREFYKY